MAFERLVAFHLTLAQRARGQAIALRFAPPARSGQGKAPQDRFIFIEEDNLALASLVLEGGEFERRIGQRGWVGIEPASRAAVT